MLIPDEAPKRRRGRPRSEAPTPRYLERRDEIVATATEVFRLKGDAAGTLQEVADILGLQRASLYHYVDSKAHLLSLICEQVMNVVIDALEEIARIEDPLERLVAAIRVHVRTIARHQDVFKVFFDARASLSGEDRERMRNLEATYVASFAATVEAAIDAEVLPRTDSRQAALALIGLGSWPYKWFDPQRDDPELYADVCLALLLEARSSPTRAMARSRHNSKRGRDTVALGIDGLEVALGAHLCGLYRGRSELDQILTQFLGKGLRSGDKTICVIDSQSPDELVASLEGTHGVAEYVHEPQLEVVRSTEAYLRGDHFEVDEMLAWWDERVRESVTDQGFPRVRAAAEMSWALHGFPGSEDLSLRGRGEPLPHEPPAGLHVSLRPRAGERNDGGQRREDASQDRHRQNPPRESLLQGA